MAYEITQVGYWMTKDPITVDASATIIEVIHMLKEHNVRRFPVMKGGRLVGLITERMIKEFTPSRATALDTWEVHYLLSRTPVTEAMNPTPLSIRPETDLTEAASLINTKKLNGILVTGAANELIGLFTTTDALRAVIELAKLYKAEHGAPPAKK